MGKTLLTRLKLVTTRPTRTNDSKWQKRVVLVIMTQNGVNAAYSSKYLKMVKTQLTCKNG